jgi:hypothetical protein
MRLNLGKKFRVISIFLKNELNFVKNVMLFFLMSVLLKWFMNQHRIDIEALLVTLN